MTFFFSILIDSWSNNNDNCKLKIIIKKEWEKKEKEDGKLALSWSEWINNIMQYVKMRIDSCWLHFIRNLYAFLMVLMLRFYASTLQGINQAL